MKSEFKQLCALLLLSTMTTMLNAQTKPSSAKASGSAEITDLIIYDHILYDTSRAETVGQKWAGATINDYNLAMNRRYLDVDQSRNFRNELSNLIKRKDLFYFDGNNAMTHQKVMERITVLYSVEDLDSLGNVVGIRTISDTIDMRKWSMVTFYEEWKLNRANGMIEKNVIGYVFHWYSDDKNIWIPMFGIARDKAAQEKIKKLAGW